MTTDEIKRGLECCASNDNWCGECPYRSWDECSLKLKRHVLEYVNSLEKLSTLEADKTNRGIDPDELLNRLQDWQAKAQINELTESKAVFDISIAIVEDMVKEMGE